MEFYDGRHEQFSTHLDRIITIWQLQLSPRQGNENKKHWGSDAGNKE